MVWWAVLLARSLNEGHSFGAKHTSCLRYRSKKCEWDKFVYFSSFSTSALAATSPGACAAKLWYKVENVSQRVASQTSGFPEAQGMIVTPSGHLPSSLDRPGGSKQEGILAEERALQITSFRAACLGCLPSLLLQLKKCLPKGSTDWPHLWQWWGAQRGVPGECQPQSTQNHHLDVDQGSRKEEHATRLLIHDEMRLEGGLCQQCWVHCQAIS